MSLLLLCSIASITCSGKKKGNNLALLAFGGSGSQTEPTNNQSTTEVTIDSGASGSTAAGIVFTKSSISISESGLVDSVGISLARKPNNNVNLSNITVTGDSSVVLSHSNLIFTPNDWDTRQYLTVSTIDNLVASGNKSFQISIQSVISSDSAYQGINVPTISGTSIDNDISGITLTSNTNLSVSETGSIQKFQVQLNSKPTHSVVVNLSSSNPTEGVISPSSVTISPEDWNQPVEITITGVDDAIKDGLKSFNVQFPSVSSTDPVYNNYLIPSFSVTNSDNDIASIVVNQLETKTTEGGGEAGVTIKLGSQPTGDVNVTLQLTAGDTDEAALSTTTLLFTQANWNSIQNIKLTGNDDPSIDGNRGYQLTISTNSTEDAVYNSEILPINLSFTNEDNDTAGFLITPNGGLVTSENGDSAIFSIRLLSKPTNNVTIPLSTSDSTEGIIQGGVNSIIFQPSDWNIEQTVTIIGIDDSDLDRNQNFQITLGSVSSADSHYSGLNPTDVSVTNSDNDTAGITVIASLPFNVNETASGTNKIFIRLNKIPTSSVRIPNILTSSTSLATASVSALNFTTVNWNVWQEITITGVENNIDELTAGQNFTISFGNSESSDSAYNGVNINSITGTLLDNDTSSFTVTISNLYRNASYTDADTLTLLLSDDSLFTGSISIKGTSMPSANVVIPVSSLNSNLNLSKPNLQLTAANWNTGDKVNISGIVDSFTGEAFGTYVQLGNASGKANPNGTAYDSAVIKFNNVVANVFIQTCESTGKIYTCSRASTLFQKSPPLIRTGEKNTTAGIYYIAMRDEPSQNVNFRASVNLDTEAHISVAKGGSGTTYIKSADNKRNVSANLIFKKTDYKTLRSVSLLGVDETDLGLTNDIDGNKPFQVSHTLSSSDPAYNGFSLPARNGINVDNDTTFLVLSPINSSSARYYLTRTNGPSRSFTFTVSMSVPPKAGKSVTFPLSLTPSGQATLNKTNLVFDSTNWNVPQSVTATAVLGASLSSTNYSMKMSPLVSDDPSFIGQTVADVLLTNTYPRILLSKTSVNVAEWGELQPSVTGGRETFTVSLTSPIPITMPATSLTISIVSSDPSEVMTSPSTLTFTNANWRTAQTVTVIGRNDATADGNKTGTIQFNKNTIGDPSYDAIIIPVLNYTNLDDDNY